MTDQTNPTSENQIPITITPMYARSHQRKLRQMSFHYPHLPVAVAAATTARPIGNNFGNIRLVGPNWRLLSACLPGGKTFPGGHLKEERKRRGEVRRGDWRRIQSLLSPHSHNGQAGRQAGGRQAPWTSDLRASATDPSSASSRRRRRLISRFRLLLSSATPATPSSSRRLATHMGNTPSWNQCSTMVSMYYTCVGAETGVP